MDFRARWSDVLVSLRCWCINEGFRLRWRQFSRALHEGSDFAVRWSFFPPIFFCAGKRDSKLFLLRKALGKYADLFGN